MFQIGKYKERRNYTTLQYKLFQSSQTFDKVNFLYRSPTNKAEGMIDD